MEITIDRSGCISCGICADACPEVFHMAEDNLSEVIHQPNSSEEESAKEAAESCPVSVIHVQ